ncbi:MAG: efflux RND transporter permease subunit [Rikenellaceae bacterium]
MSIPEYALRNRNLTWFLLALFLVGGVLSFFQLGKKEDSVFVIKSASIICSYPGATPAEVELLVTEPLEREVQSMRSIYKITSESQFGLSKILVELDPAAPPGDIPQLWDELRRKVLNVMPQLPSAAQNVVIADDYGDVFGIYYALSASEGFSFSELRDWAQQIKTRVITIDGVQKVTLYGEQTPVVNLFVSLSQLSNFSIRPDQIISTIASQNGVVSSGEKQAGEMQIRILEEGSYHSLNDIEDQLLIASDGKQYRLGDFATIEHGYMTPTTSLMRVNGRRAIGIGIATEGDKDVVATGGKISEVLRDIERTMPLGINLEVLYPEDKIASEATTQFLLNLLESIAIVILVIMAIMGLRSGLLIGSSLIFSIGATLLIMLFIGEGLNRTSLAGFIIAMGMLVDNAIVVVDNAINSIANGVDKRRAVVDGANNPKWSLLGATLIAIFSFLPLYLAPSAVAEIVKPLFVVLAISLLMSWVLALIQTPLFGIYILKTESATTDKNSNTEADNKRYDTKFYRWFDRVLISMLRRRWLVVAASVVALFIAGEVMNRMPQDFFPSLDKPYFRADIILPDGYNIDATEERMLKMEQWLQSQDQVKNVSMTMGGTPPRYYLASSAVSLMPNFGNILVELHDVTQSADIESRFNRYVRDSFPDVWIRSSLFKLSPVPDASIEMGFIGENIDTLIKLTKEAEEIMWRNPRATNVRNSWGNNIATWQPIYSQMKGGRIGISRSDLAQGLKLATSGYPLGEYRQGDQIMPILMKDENQVGYNLTNMETMPIFTSRGRMFIVEQASSGFNFEYETAVVKRYNRRKVMKAQCDPERDVNTKALYAELLDSINSNITIPNGYLFKVFGEEEAQVESNEALAKNFPLTIVLIFVTLLILFGTYREPIVIMAMIPFIFIGVVFGLWAAGKLFNFFALLGLLGLIGMNVKNGVVLVAQIGDLQQSGYSRAEALLEATRSRIVPVAMASGTTILGMTPLLFDSLFGAMAATIMGGLVVATLLTFCLLPVSYAIIYNIKNDQFDAQH